MATGTKDFEVNQGDTFSEPITWLDANRDPVPLSGYTARMQVRTSADATDFILELTTENGGITLDDPGSITLEITADDMAAVDAGSYKYDLEMVSGSGVVKKLIKGKFKVLAEITKDDT